MGSGQRVYQGVKLAVYNGRDVEILIIPAQAVIGHAVLREVIGAHSVAPVARTDLALALGGDGGILLGALRLIELGAE